MMRPFLLAWLSVHLGLGLGLELGSPRIKTVSREYRVEAGGQVELECSVEQLGSMVLMWKQGPRVLTAGNMMVRRDKRLQLRGNNLVISQLEVDDGGQYDCEIEADGDLPISVSHRLDILLPPRVVSEPADGRVVVKKGSSVTIKCLTSGNPRPRVTWSKVNQADVVGEGESLELREVSRHQEGIYQCSAGNGVGERAVSQIHLRVLYKPEVSAEETVVHAGVGHQAILVCQVHASPEAEVTWYRGTLLMESDNRMYREVVGSRHSLTIHQVREEEFTGYHCKASNSLGQHSAKITISGKPRAPSIEHRVEVLGEGSYRVSWNTESFAPIEQYRLLYRKAPAEGNPGHSYAWTSVVIPGPQHTRQQDSANRASFTLDSLEIEAEYQLQLQARNSFGWGKVSHQFNFQTNMVESTPVEEVRKEFSLYQLSGTNPAFTSDPLLLSSLLLTLLFSLLLR